MTESHPIGTGERLKMLEDALERIANARTAMDGGSIAECRRIAETALSTLRKDEAE